MISKMKLLRQTSFIKLFIVAGIILALVCGVYFAVSTNNKNTAETTQEFHLLVSTTPTPYPLPAEVYIQPSFLTTLWSQVFGSKKKLTNPDKIIANGQIKFSDERMDLYVRNGYFPVDARWWQPESGQVYEYVRARLDAAASEKVIVMFVPPEPGNCAPRGTTIQEEQPVILIYANQDTSKNQILATLAHELGHVFIHKKYPNLSDVALSEGMATWAAGDYWKAWKGVDFNAAVRSYSTGKTYLSLFQNYDMKKAYADMPGCITYRDMLVTEFASFIDYLIQTYGIEKLPVLFDVQQPEIINNRRIVYPPNFKVVYGFELNQLEQEWLRNLLL
jgi:hypothetical protein